MLIMGFDKLPVDERLVRPTKGDTIAGLGVGWGNACLIGVALPRVDGNNARGGGDGVRRGRLLADSIDCSAESPQRGLIGLGRRSGLAFVGPFVRALNLFNDA